MKDQYFGDINDFQKYALLRALTSGSDASLAVCWMLTPPDGRSDGRHTRYLDHPDQWARFDPELFAFLKETLQVRGTRAVAAIEGSGLLGDAAFQSAMVPAAPPQRARWLGQLLTATAEAGTDLVFFDPDNGLEVRSVPHGRAGSPKYLYWHEAEQTYARGHSLLIYQHFPRVARGPYMERLAAELRHRCGTETIVAFATSRVVFLLVPQLEHETQFKAAAEPLRSAHRGGFEVRLL